MKLVIGIAFIALLVNAPTFTSAQNASDAWTRIARPGYEEYAPVTLANGVYGITLSEKALIGNRVQLNGIFDEFPDSGTESALQTIDFSHLELIVMNPEAQPTERADFLKGKSFAKASLDELANWQQEFNFREGWFKTNFDFEGLSVEHTVYALKHMLQTGIVKVTIRAREDRFFSIKNVLSTEHPYTFQSSQYLSQLRERQIPLFTASASSPTGKYTLATTSTFHFADENHHCTTPTTAKAAPPSVSRSCSAGGKASPST